MWIKDMSSYLSLMKIKYGVSVEIRVTEYDRCLSFTVSRGDFHKRQSLMLEQAYAMGDKTAFFEGVLEDMAREVSDAYEETNKSREWNVILQDIGVREE